MKTALSFTNVVVVALSLMGLVTACQSTSVGSGTAPQKEALLVQAGFRAKTVTTPKQQERVSALPAGKCRPSDTTETCITYIRLRRRIGSWLAIKRSTNAYKQAVVAYGLTTSPSFVQDTARAASHSSSSSSMISVRFGSDHICDLTLVNRKSIWPGWRNWQTRQT